MLLIRLDDPAVEMNAVDEPRKRRRLDGGLPSSDGPTLQDWLAFESLVNEFEAQHVLAKSKFVFTFVEGPLVRAVRSGHW